MNDKTKVKFLIILFLALIILSAFNVRLKVVEYIVKSPKITEEIRLVLVTDLHSCKYGENQSELLNKIVAYNPDAVLLGGDIFDDVLTDENSQIFVSQAVEKYKTFYVSGNHEWWSGNMYEHFKWLNAHNVTVLRGDCVKFKSGEQIINICGIDDPEVSRYDDTYFNSETQLKNSVEKISKDSFNLLLAHRPELIETYCEYGFDLMLSGHAHGGQWRIPLIMNGFYAPNQGFLPKYAGGMYELGDKRFIVSRGLSRENSRIPRIFNRPELIFITIE